MDEHRFTGGTGISSSGSAMVVLNNNGGPGKFTPMPGSFEPNAQQPVGGQPQPGMNKPPPPQYSMAGILQFLQTEWAKFEVQKANWDMERAELQARIAFLDGERRAQENLKRDLVRRIKMLEYALKQERSKFHKLRYGVELDFTQPQTNRKAQIESQAQPVTKANSNQPHQANAENGGLGSIGQARQLLRTYLREVGYTDTILDVRNVRVRQMLGLQQSSMASDPEKLTGTRTQSGGVSTSPDTRSAPGGPRAIKGRDRPPADESLSTAPGGHAKAISGMSDDGGLRSDNLENSQQQMFEGANEAPFGVEDMIGGGDADEQEVLAEFDYLVNTQSEQPLDSLNLPGMPNAPVPSGDGPDDWHVDQNVIQNMKDEYVKGRRGRRGHGPPVEEAPVADDDNTQPPSFTADLDDTEPFRVPQADRGEEMLGDRQLGELAELAVPGAEEEPGLEMVGSGRHGDVKNWAVKYTLRSHFDGVRAVAFHPYDAAVLTASEDGSVKLWSLQRTVQSKKTVAFDVEPTYTFRAHTGPALCLTLNQAGTNAFSGGIDGSIRMWHVPSILMDLYDPYDPSVMMENLEGHSDAVWSLAMHPTQPNLLSASADGSVRLWSVAGQPSAVNTYRLFGDDVPTSVSYQQTDPSHCLVATRNGDCYNVDLERAVAVCRFEPPSDDLGDCSSGRCAYRVVSQSMTPSCVCAYEDRTIRFFDTLTGQQSHAMVAHLDAVTSLAIDPSGLYLLSASHDSSVRIWTLEGRSCVQEITAHRKKFAESIHDLAVHPHKPLFASAGADALAKVFAA